MAHTITVTELGEYIRHQSCDRRFKLSFNNREEATKLPFADRLFNTIDPVLKASGKEKENQWEESLIKSEVKKLNHDQNRTAEASLDDFFRLLASEDFQNGNGSFGREIEISGLINDFEINGRIDFLICQMINGIPTIRIVECKASRKDRTYHRIQVYIYKLLLKEYLKTNSVKINGIEFNPENIECVVARIDESTNNNQDILALTPLVLDREEADTAYLLDFNGPFNRIISSNINDLDYQLNEKCDGCVFNVHCFSESGRKKSLELLSINPTAVRILKQAGLNSLDDLAELPLDGEHANQVRNNPSFSYNLNLLAKKAKARRNTLVGSDTHPDEYSVEAFPATFQSQLPSYDINGNRLIRIYMAVDYDYVENRLVSISAHITKSDKSLKTVYERPNIFEVNADAEEYPVGGEVVIKQVDSVWNGNFEIDNGVERQLISSFFRELIDKISTVAEASEAPIHFYVWSRNELKALVEACSRVDTSLLNHLNQLLGCRQSLEQLIFSCLQDEVDNRYALGWTGRGLSVVTSLSWFGNKYHWVRTISGSNVYLDRAFTQDIFDFKTDLELNSVGGWGREGASGNSKHKFEIRSRFNDGLTVPYWHAYWGQLADPNTPGLDPKIKASIKRYKEAIKPGYLNSFLKNRVYALRWIEERITFKNNEIEKPLLEIGKLAEFDLNVNHTRRAALDFLRLDFQIGLNDWLSKNILPPINRIISGGTVPISNLVKTGDRVIQGQIDLGNSGLNIEVVKNNSSFAVGSFVRISPYSGDLHRGQTIGQLLRGGITAVIDQLDWDTREITFSTIPSGRNSSDYILSSFTGNTPTIYTHATVDESVSDFVSNKVERRLRTQNGEFVNSWFDPENPAIPPISSLPDDKKALYEGLLNSFEFSGEKKLKPDQIKSIIESFNTRIQLLLGPPGTGKTMTTAIAVLLHAVNSEMSSQKFVIAASTHMAVNNLLSRINLIKEEFLNYLSANGVSTPTIRIAKIDPREDLEDGIEEITARSPVTKINELSRNSILIMGGTTSALLTLSENSGTTPFTTQFLIVDEASMMVFPHFLALATLMDASGRIILTGDHRQLSPIISHDWENEDRPPVIIYQPYLSAYEAIRGLALKRPIPKNAITLSALEYTFRLPADIRDLIARLYKEDNVTLSGNTDRHIIDYSSIANESDKFWVPETGIFLVLHDERKSRKSNTLEASIIKKIIGETSRQIEDDSIAVITPHRAQRTYLTNELSDYSNKVTIIDTVERLQGGEKQTIIVSATASDPSSIGANAEFILNLNRANVAFSRAQKRLIIICSQELINFIPAEIEHYDAALLWKTLRNVCNNKIGQFDIEEHHAKIYTLSRNNTGEI